MTKKLLTMFLLCVSTGVLFAQQDTIIGWTFTNENDTEFNANLGLNVNLGGAIRMEDAAGNSYNIYLKNGVTDGDFAITSEKWQNGTDTKYWFIEFNADGYKNLTDSSKQRSGGNKPGPRDWKLQVRLSGTDWTDIPNSSITAANDWTTGIVENLPLPDGFDDPGTNLINIRWIMTSDTSASGTIVDSLGVTKIDDIVITGTTVTNTQLVLPESHTSFYPNPVTNGNVYFHTTKAISYVLIFDIQGRKIKTVQSPTDFVELTGLNKGVYFIKAAYNNNEFSFTEKIVVQ